MNSSPLLINGVLYNLLRYLLTDCEHAAQRSSILLDQLSEEPGLDPDMQRVCQSMSLKLESRHV